MQLLTGKGRREIPVIATLTTLHGDIGSEQLAGQPSRLLPATTAPLQASEWTSSAEPAGGASPEELGGSRHCKRSKEPEEGPRLTGAKQPRATQWRDLKGPLSFPEVASSWNHQEWQRGEDENFILGFARGQQGARVCSSHGETPPEPLEGPTNLEAERAVPPEGTGTPPMGRAME